MKKIALLLPVALLLTSLPCAAQGPLTPTNGPAPTMYTLEEIYQKLLTTEEQLLSVQQQLNSVVPLAPWNYLVVDLSAGPAATNYSVSYLAAAPAGGWTDEYKTTKLVLRRLPAGTFTMGSPINEFAHESNENQHQVTLTQPFYVGVFEVTQKQWERVMGTWPSSFTNATYRESRPVEQVSYDMIRGTGVGTNWPASGDVDGSSFMGRLRARTGRAFELPTESQWEYAGRALALTALNSGYDLTNTGSDPKMSEVGRYWYNGGSNYTQNGDATVGTARVGTYAPNAWGLYDIHGNVYEWCLDWYGGYPGAGSDPSGASGGSSRVLRGGSWYSYARYCRVAYRQSYMPDTSVLVLGFRAVLPPGQ
jgi:formylglycine-generating enzyme required for sulfatase activity